MMENIDKDMWTSFFPSSVDDIQALETESFKEATQLYAKYPRKATELLDSLINYLDLRKIFCDMYVWQRVEAIKKGINQAKETSSESDKLGSEAKEC